MAFYGFSKRYDEIKMQKLNAHFSQKTHFKHFKCILTNLEQKYNC